MRDDYIVDPKADFNSRYDIKENGCWVWSGTIMWRGYGTVVYKQRIIRAHRLSWEIHNGKIPEGMYVCHHCDNPPCVNPDHLFLGTPQDNVADMDKKGRRNPRKGEELKISKLNKIKVIDIFTSDLGRSELASMYSVSLTSILNIKNGNTWKHVTEGLT